MKIFTATVSVVAVVLFLSISSIAWAAPIPENAVKVVGKTYLVNENTNQEILLTGNEMALKGPNGQLDPPVVEWYYWAEMGSYVFEVNISQIQSFYSVTTFVNGEELAKTRSGNTKVSRTTPDVAIEETIEATVRGKFYSPGLYEVEIRTTPIPFLPFLYFSERFEIYVQNFDFWTEPCLVDGEIRMRVSVYPYLPLHQLQVGAKVLVELGEKGMGFEGELQGGYWEGQLLVDLWLSPEEYDQIIKDDRGEGLVVVCVNPGPDEVCEASNRWIPGFKDLMDCYVPNPTPVPTPDPEVPEPTEPEIKE